MSKEQVAALGVCTNTQWEKMSKSLCGKRKTEIHERVFRAYQE